MSEKWVKTNLEDLENDGTILLGRGKVISKNDMKLHPGTYPVYSSAQGNNGAIGEYGDFMFDEEMITWSIDGGGHIFYRPKHRFSVTNIGGYVRILKSERLSCAFLSFVMQQQQAQHAFDWQHKAHPSVLRKLYVGMPIPPLPVQRRIVDLMTHLDAHLANLKEEGQRLRVVYGVRSEEIFSSIDEESWVRLGQVSEIAMGPFGSSIKVDTFVSDGVPIIIGRNLEDFHVSDKDFRFISEEHALRLARANVRAGDIVVTHRGTLGQVSLVPESSAYKRYCISQSHFRISCDPSRLNPEFCTEYLRSRQGQRHLLSAKGGTGIPAITKATTHAKQLEVPMPLLGQQEMVVAELRAFRAAVSKLNAELNSLQCVRNSLLDALLHRVSDIDCAYDKILQVA